MRLFGKCALLIAPLLAGCAAMQLSSQGAGTKPGGKANSNSMAFPEDRDWLADAGMSQYKDYAKYLRPNVGIPEDKLGMSMKQFREIEKQIREAVLSEKPKTVLDRIKKEKFGVVATANGATAAPADVKQREFMKWFRSQPEQIKADGLKEVANHNKLTGALNDAVFDYILSKTDAVLASNGVNPSNSQVLRAKAFVAGAAYFTQEAVAYESLIFSLGSSAAGERVRKIGAFVLDRPRGVCDEQTLTLIYLVNAKGAELGLRASYYFAETSTKDPKSDQWLGYNHAVGLVRYEGQYQEAYDVTKQFKIDSRDPDAAARWVTSYTGVDSNPPFARVELSQLKSAEGDPISTMTRAEFQSLDKNISNKIRSTVR